MQNRIISPLLIVFIILTAIVIFGLLHPGIPSYLIVLAALLLASLLMVLHLLLAWRRLTVPYRLSILLCVIAWLAMFYGLV
ncbi:MAG TPA: hypothetical protein P5549_09765 [Syntrophomonas sp.]|jgi:ABC-type Fe3+-siderophore transport system permease subunit|nr:hypothetical protein [Syntrophomonas sp.]